MSHVEREWVVENEWGCPACNKKNLGRFTTCQHCGHVKDKTVEDESVTGLEPEVTDPELLHKAKAGANAICPFCDGQIRMIEDR